ncbi:WW domain binding protein 1-like isoform X1 [Brienomyrus brachyistius]|uniref:WW domain binding protein 1-like isoform X1 n=1 Tax=Brienomyrus brachyistius TaxID=42636 RepID=UPI0020B32916|nr:WW domain binding protein 1-like isoform X1 [Brienomyrus brachyistius]
MFVCAMPFASLQDTGGKKEIGCLKMRFILFYFAGPIIPVATETVAKENKLICYDQKNQSYTCESGQCCGESECCGHYYQLWWFWLVWTLIITLSCCCICHHRRAKLRLQQQQRQHEINLIAYREAHNNSSLPFYFRLLPSYLLPAYDEVVSHPPTPPPPYSVRPPSQMAPLDPFVPERTDELQPLSSPRPRECEPAPPDAQEDEVSEQQREGKEQTPGRHRRFTGDSGIEVCVCSHRQGGDPLEPLDFCEGCIADSPGNEEPGMEPRALGYLLHTINEQEGHSQANSPGPQS